MQIVRATKASVVVDQTLPNICFVVLLCLISFYSWNCQYRNYAIMRSDKTLLHNCHIHNEFRANAKPFIVIDVLTCHLLKRSIEAVNNRNRFNGIGPSELSFNVKVKPEIELNYDTTDALEFSNGCARRFDDLCFGFSFLCV